jgi:nucleotide-binding universal stress UspA family protein
MPTVKLRDGSRARLRPIAPDDKQILADAVRRMSVESRYRRFFSYADELSHSALAYLTEVDHVDHEAIIAIEPHSGEALGVARFVRRLNEPDSAEVAFAVVDDWQGRGLGRALLTELTARARQEGVRKFVALVQYENRRSLGMLRGINTPTARSYGPEQELTVELPGQRGIGVQLAALLRAAAEGAIEAGQSVMSRTSHSTSALARWRPVDAVVIGSDGSETAEVAVAAAIDVAARYGAALHVVSAYKAPTERPGALAIVADVERAAQPHAVKVTGHALLGEPATLIMEVADEHEASLVVVGSKGLTGPASLLGSVPNTVTRHARCSVLVVRTT